ncbi:hypothetical protein ACXJJ3_07455 [Kribbella sp. WER1]
MMEQVFAQLWPASQAQNAKGRPNKVIHYTADPARRTLREIDEQVAKPRAVAWQLTVK